MVELQITMVHLKLLYCFCTASGSTELRASFGPLDHHVLSGAEDHIASGAVECQVDEGKAEICERFEKVVLFNPGKDINASP